MCETTDLIDQHQEGVRLAADDSSAVQELAVAEAAVPGKLQDAQSTAQRKLCLQVRAWHVRSL